MENRLMQNRTLALIIPIALTLATYLANAVNAGPYSPLAGQSGSTAIANTSPAFVERANGYQNLIRGPQNIASPGGPFATVGDPTFALGPADGNSGHVVSLGDGGQITLTFAQPITNGCRARPGGVRKRLRHQRAAGLSRVGLRRSQHQRHRLRPLSLGLADANHVASRLVWHHRHHGH